jgi:hypothetical protein
MLLNTLTHVFQHDETLELYDDEKTYRNPCNSSEIEPTPFSCSTS